MKIITVRELMDTGVDVDLGNDLLDLELPAYCGPVELTAKAEEEFADVLALKMEYMPEKSFAVLLLEGKERMFDRCAEFFEALAGYCCCERFDELFRYPDLPALPFWDAEAADA